MLLEVSLEVSVRALQVTVRAPQPRILTVFIVDRSFLDDLATSLVDLAGKTWEIVNAPLPVFFSN